LQLSKILMARNLQMQQLNSGLWKTQRIEWTDEINKSLNLSISADEIDSNVPDP
jgi:hypothetical protein